MLLNDLDVDVNSKWMELSEAERKQHERALIQLVFAPAFSELIGLTSNQHLLETRVAAWKFAVTENADLFEEPQFWYDVVAFLKQLAAVYDQDFPGKDDIPGNHTLLVVFWYLIASTRKGVQLSDSLSMQVSAVLPFVERPEVGKHMFEGLGRFIYRYWSEVAARRRFALKNPDLFQQVLSRINSGHGAKTAVAVLIRASDAVGARLPADIVIQLQKLEST